MVTPFKKMTRNPCGFGLLFLLYSHCVSTVDAINSNTLVMGRGDLLSKYLVCSTI